MIFCLSCKKHTNDINPIGKLTSNNKPYVSAKCNIYKKMKSKFASVNQIKGNCFLSNIFKNIPVLNTIFLLSFKLIIFFIFINWLIIN